VNILIFGHGRVAETKYLPWLLRAFPAGSPPSGLRLVFVDKGKDGCLEVGDWESHIEVPLGEIDRILILSIPQAHLDNLRSIAAAYSARGVNLPEVYTEKPLYLIGEGDKWSEFLSEHPVLEKRAFYINHYRYEDTVRWLLGQRADLLGALGPIREIGFVSLGKQAFWDSAAFGAGYFLEHGCHFVTMLWQVFPELRGAKLVARRRSDWRAWAQSGRPSSCKSDNAVLLYLSPTGVHNGALAQDSTITVIIGKGMLDRKLLFIQGEKGSCQVWFNEGRIVLNQEVCLSLGAVRDPYQGVLESILAGEKDCTPLLPLLEGIAEQEAVIAIQKNLPTHFEEYTVGDVPQEIARELEHMGAGYERGVERA
jgi:hypothetical protein